MATSELTAVPSNVDDAAFRAWGQQVAAALQDVGLVQTADTGQINWATVTTPTAGNQQRGFELYRFDDDLQATAPVFVKVEYGSNGNGAEYPGLRVQVATATDGAGGLSGTAGTWMSDPTASNNSIAFNANPRDIWASGGDGYLHLAVWSGGSAADSNHIGMELHIERTVDAAGDATDEALLIVSGTGDQHRYHVLRYDSPGSKSYATFGNAPFRDEPRVMGTDVFFCPLFVAGQSGEAKLYGPFHDLLLYWHADISGHPDVTVNHYGADHTYRCLHEWSMYHVHHGNSLSSGGVLAMRWE